MAVIKVSPGLGDTNLGLATVALHSLLVFLEVALSAGCMKEPVESQPGGRIGQRVLLVIHKQISCYLDKILISQ